MRKHSLLIAATVLYIVVLSCAELIPVNAPKWDIDKVGVDKLTHAFAYGVMTLLIFHSCRRVWRIAPLLFVFAHGIAIEFAQTCMPNRTADMYDLLSNFVGIITVMVSIRLSRLFAGIIRRGSS